MTFLSINQLTSQPFRNSKGLNEDHGVSKARSKVIFLSYRRRDRNLVKPIVDFLLREGVKVYIDYLDNGLEGKPSAEIAAILRGRISSSDKFILIATPNSSESKWISWELGLGDGFDGYTNTIVLPITANSQNWLEQEYFELYGYVAEVYSRDKTKTGWAVIYPDKPPIWLKDWFLS